MKTFLIIHLRLMCSIGLIVSANYLFSQSPPKEWYDVYEIGFNIKRGSWKTADDLLKNSLHQDSIFKNPLGNYYNLRIQEHYGRLRDFIQFMDRLDDRTTAKLCIENWKPDIESSEDYRTICSSFKNYSGVVPAQLDTLLLSRLMILKMEDQLVRGSNGEMHFKDEDIRILNDLGVYDFESKIRNLPFRELRSLHHQEVGEILEEYGIPSFDNIGKDGMNALFVLLVHESPDYIKGYLSDLKMLFTSSQIAFLVDKACVAHNQPQEYGTQVEYSQKDNRVIFYRLEDAQQLDAKRYKVGLGPIEYYAKEVNVDWEKEKIRLGI